MTDEQTGNKVATYDYDPYGAPTSSSATQSTDLRYAGMFYLQGAGLYLTKYRAYDSGTGRWISRDPIGEAGGVNLYTYVNNSPLNYVDPNGEFLINPITVGAAIGAISGGIGAYNTNGDVLGGILGGAVAGAAAGLAPFSAPLSAALLGSTAGGLGNLAGQFVGDKVGKLRGTGDSCKQFTLNYNQALVQAAYGAVGG